MKIPLSKGPRFLVSLGVFVIFSLFATTAFAQGCAGAVGIVNDGTDFNGNLIPDYLFGDLATPVQWTLTPAAGAGQLPITVDQVRFGLTCFDNDDEVPCANGNDGQAGNPGLTPLQFISLDGGSCGATLDSNAGGVVTFNLPEAILNQAGCTIIFTTELQDYGIDASPNFVTPAIAFDGTCSGGLIGSAAGSASIEIVEPSIDVTKTGPALAKVGDEITYTIGFTASADDILLLGVCTGNDPLLGGDLGVFTDGVTRDFPYTVLAGDPNPLLNTATITCDVPAFASNVSDFDDHSVVLIEPSIDVTKTGPALAKVGDEITYTIGFTDTSVGGVLGVCTGSDPLLGGDLGVFTAGVTRDFPYTVLAGDPDPLLNTATITCDVEGVDNAASGSANHSVDLIAPSIDVTKTGPALAKVGDEITYTIGFTDTSVGGVLGVCTGSDPLLGGDLGVFTAGVTRDFPYTVLAGDPDPLLNTATITCDVEGVDNAASGSASHSVDLIAPSIDVTKTGPALAKVGDEITYTIGFTDTSVGGVLGVCTGSDPLLGGDLGVFTAGVTRDFPYTVLAGDPDPLLNTATITCDVEGVDNAASGSASHSVDLIAPSIDVTKTGPALAKVGDEITYTIGFTDTSVGGVLGVCTGSDPLLGGDLGVFTAGVTRDFPYTVLAGDPDPLLNTATITCDVEGVDNAASGSASHSVDLIAPSIDVTKTGPALAKVGDEITYTIGFTDTSVGGVLGVCTGSDPLLGGDLGVFTAGVTRDFPYTVLVGDPDPLLNTATITCDVEGVDNAASGSASHSVDLIAPSIDVTKTGPALAKVGDEITYTIGFTDTSVGGVLGVCTGSDPLLGGDLGVFTAGVTRDFPYTVLVGDPDPLLNTATITCDVEGVDNAASGSASHSVDLIAPSIDVTKTGPDTAKAGDEITYTIGFTDTSVGGVLGVCTGSDPLLGGDLGVFTAGVTRDFPYTVLAGDPDPLLNTATITCDVEGVDNAASGSASHSVDLIAPSIDVTKTGPALAKVGDEITYTIGFTDTSVGGVLGVCTGSDPLLGGDLGVFTAGVTRDFPYTVLAGDPDPLLNTATITCDVEGVDNAASGSANHSVDLIAPSIDVTKTGPALAKVGDEITYTIGFTDTSVGGVLGICTGSDPLLGGDLGVFTAGVTRDFPYTVLAGDPDPLLNTATITCDVEGVDNAASGSASHSVDLIAPSIDVTKTGPALAKVGDEITYTIGFTDTSVGGVLGVCTGSDPLLGGDLGVFTAGVTRDFPYTVLAGDPDPLLNTATITCDVEGVDNAASGSASHSVDLIAPSIDVTKTGPALAKVGDEITYTIGFTDTSVGGVLGVCTGSDPLLGGDLGVFTAGVTRDFPYTVLAGDPDPLLNTATITCDVEGVDNAASGSASHSVDLIAPSIDVTKTGPALAKVGDEITYTIGFTDTSVGGVLGICTGNDPLLGGDLGVFTAGVTRDFPYTVLAGDPDPLLNTATITCDVEGVDNAASGSASHSVDLIAPSIDVTKTGPALAKVGDEITYTIGFTDTSVGGVLGVCTGSDPLLGGDLGVFTAGVTRDFPYTVLAGDPDPLLNTATITCDVEGVDNAASGSASHSVDLIAPSIDVTKTGPALAKVGDEITYTIGFTDTSVGGVLGVCTGSDPLLGGDLGVFTAGVTRDFPYTVLAGDPDPLLNTATITCDVEGVDNAASGSASHSVDLIAPSIDVTKTGPDAAKVGDEITYTIGFTDTSVGGVLGVCTGSDPLLGGDLGVFTAGVTRDFPYTVLAGDPDPLLNTATITCDVEGVDNAASGSASHSVDLIAPSIDVTKTGPDAAKVGDEITYTIGFTDTSVGGTLGICTGNDPLLGGDLGVFTAGVTRDFPYTVLVGDPNPLLNTATITCDVLGFDNDASGEASHSVVVINPSVELSKECTPDPVLLGDLITWNITVDNTGDVDLECTVNDPTAGIVDEPVAVAALSSETINASRIVVAADAPVISNTATVVCPIPGFDNVLDDVATADCEVRGNEICRTPGFWKTHAGVEKGAKSQNVTQAVIDQVNPPGLNVCGTFITNTDAGNSNSAVEAMCISVRGETQRQLVRQLTAAALNCVMSGGDGNCTGVSIQDLQADCNAACVGDPSDRTMNECIDEIDCFNNGGDWDAGMCTYGTGLCVISGEDCSDDVGCPGIGDECMAFETCHDRDLCPDGGDLCIEPPHPASSTSACKVASKNDIYVP